MTSQPPFDADLFDLLVCPEARCALKWVDGRLVSTDAATRRCYRVEDGMPIMLIDESQVLDEAAWRSLMAQPGPIGQGPDAVRARHATSQR
jgi:uncharacterized protein YbaR (Trm112 family)